MQGLRLWMHAWQKGEGIMPFGEGVKVALFVMSLVFALLTAVYGLIKLASVAIMRLTKK
ncbi:MAG: hypothetical protein ACOX7B_01875 [Christensenellales bacterium]|jgi:hypothetical protein